MKTISKSSLFKMLALVAVSLATGGWIWLLYNLAKRIFLALRS
jgi:hypothetical protein